jgi:alkylhydroperoxidase family enzyme
MSRVAPLQPPYALEVKEVFDRIMRGAPPLMLFRVMASQPRAWDKFRAGSLLDPGPLSLREREIVIDRTCARCGSEYEWGVHVAFFAERVGLTAPQVAATLGSDATAFPERERLLLRLVDALHDRAQVEDDLWAALRAHWSEEQLVELVALAGFYHLIAFVTNALRIPLEPYAARFPRPGDGTRSPRESPGAGG